jgi:hypothetical protein
MNFKLNLPYPITTKEKEAEKGSVSNSERTVNIINSIVTVAFEKGFESGGEKRTYGRLQTKLDNALEDGKDTVVIEEADKDLLEKAIKLGSHKLPASWAKYTNLLEDEMERLKTEKEDKK